ncbi:MAG: hypothetical protein GX595_18300 [Lentisphaerae bacterium]|nr:hypothetical protein [Lentisphaerota bacterium]
MSDRDQTDATLLRCALRQCERERDAARAAARFEARSVEALTAAHRETIRGAAEYLRNMGDFRLACDLMDILTTAGEAKDAPPVARHGMAPEHVQTLKDLSELHDGWTEATCAIRAALTALGEPAP